MILGKTGAHWDLKIFDQSFIMELQDDAASLTPAALQSTLIKYFIQQRKYYFTTFSCSPGLSSLTGFLSNNNAVEYG